MGAKCISLLFLHWVLTRSFKTFDKIIMSIDLQKQNILHLSQCNNYKSIYIYLQYIKFVPYQTSTTDSF